MRTLAWSVLFALGCGPVTATSVVNDAEVALLRAHAADSDKWAPYDTVAGDAYLAKAKEEQGHAHYAEATELGRKALSHAQAATKKALELRGSDVPPPAPKATIQHGEGGK